MEQGKKVEELAQDIAPLYALFGDRMILEIIAQDYKLEPRYERTNKLII
jgi:hypothetical protein